MKKPKIKIVPCMGYPVYYRVQIHVGRTVIEVEGEPRTRKAAREWAKEWCATVGAALLDRAAERDTARREAKRTAMPATIRPARRATK